MVGVMVMGGGGGGGVCGVCVVCVCSGWVREVLGLGSWVFEWSMCDVYYI